MMFSMKPPLLLGTGDCGLASLLVGGGVRAGGGGSWWRTLDQCFRPKVLWSTSLNTYSAATTGACHNPQNSQIISNGFKDQLIGRC